MFYTCSAELLSPSCGRESNDTNTAETLLTSEALQYIYLLKPTPRYSCVLLLCWCASVEKMLQTPDL